MNAFKYRKVAVIEPELKKTRFKLGLDVKSGSRYEKMPLVVYKWHFFIPYLALQIMSGSQLAEDFLDIGAKIKVFSLKKKTNKTMFKKN
jgi:hypothetical protein